MVLHPPIPTDQIWNPVFAQTPSTPTATGLKRAKTAAAVHALITPWMRWELKAQRTWARMVPRKSHTSIIINSYIIWRKFLTICNFWVGGRIHQLIRIFRTRPFYLNLWTRSINLLRVVFNSSNSRWSRICFAQRSFSIPLPLRQHQHWFWRKLMERRFSSVQCKKYKVKIAVQMLLGNALL